MAAKKLWLVWLPSGEGAPAPEKVGSELASQGFEVTGGPWPDQEANAWMELIGLIGDADKCDAWAVVGRKEDFENPIRRYQLSLLQTMVADARGGDFPLLVIGLDFLPEAGDLPPLLSAARCIGGGTAGWGAKAVAAVYRKQKVATEEFRFRVFAHPQLGTFFEVGPTEGEWRGVLLGVAGDAAITHHAVGPKGGPPERCTLEYPCQGIKAEIGGREYTAWSVQNTLSTEESYYVKVDKEPESIVFAGHPGEEDAEVYRLDLV